MKEIAVISPGMVDHLWVEESAVKNYLDKGWLLADNYYLKMSAEWLEKHRVFRRERLDKYLKNK